MNTVSRQEEQHNRRVTRSRVQSNTLVGWSVGRLVVDGYALRSSTLASRYTRVLSTPGCSHSGFHTCVQHAKRQEIQQNVATPNTSDVKLSKNGVGWGGGAEAGSFAPPCTNTTTLQDMSACANRVEAEHALTVRARIWKRLLLRGHREQHGTYVCNRALHHTLSAKATRRGTSNVEHQIYNQLHHNKRVHHGMRGTHQGEGCAIDGRCPRGCIDGM